MRIIWPCLASLANILGVFYLIPLEDRITSGCDIVVDVALVLLCVGSPDSENKN